jgi:hypothetical protein
MTERVSNLDYDALCDRLHVKQWELYQCYAELGKTTDPFMQWLYKDFIDKARVRLAMYRAEHLRRRRLALLCALRRRLPRDVLRWLVESYITLRRE